MTRAKSNEALRLAAVATLTTLATACGNASQASESSDGTSAQTTAALDTSTAADGACDASATAGAGWLSTSIPGSTGIFTAQFRAWGSLQGAVSPPTIDAVIGFGNGDAHAFTDLGPIVRFAPSGNIDARDGDHYAGAFPYRFDDGPYEFQLQVDVPAHTYSVWVRHLDSPNKPFELLGQDLAFRSEQANVEQLTTLNRFIDSAQGSVETCNFGYGAATACAQ